MTRLDSEGLGAAAVTALGAEPDPTGTADLICEKGSVVVAADPKAFKAAFDRLKRIDGYREPEEFLASQDDETPG